ncbi:MAG: hypothetical protein IJU04_03775 [Ruminococcus sp.]|nr:hypothetical protein [Ruminococcus sp.]
MDKRQFSNGQDLPIELNMAMAMDSKAMDYFSSLNKNDKQKLINAVHDINSKSHIRQLSDDMAHAAVDIIEKTKTPDSLTDLYKQNYL